MANSRRGYVGQYKDGCWFARVTVTGERGKRRNIVRRAKDKTQAKEVLKKMLRQVEDERVKVVDVSRMTFDNLADFYESSYLKPAEYVEGRKIAGLRDYELPLCCLKSFRDYFGRRCIQRVSHA
jgi:hypothetical protein